jgi:hypothetical protein
MRRRISIMPIITWELVLLHVRLCRSQFTVIFRVYDFTIRKAWGQGVIKGTAV